MRFLHQQVPERLVLPDQDSKALFAAEDRGLTIRSLTLLCLLAVILVLGTTVFDAMVYPEMAGLFFRLRLLCAGVLLATLLSLNTDFASRHYRAYTLFMPLVPAFFIAWMIYLARDPGSPYYAALVLCLVATGFIFHWTFTEGLIATGITLAL